MNPVPGAVGGVGEHGDGDGATRARDADVVAFGAHSDAFEVARVDDQRDSRRERGERRARRHDAPGVVQRAGGHEAETVRVGRRRRGGRDGAVPHVQCRARLELLDRALDRSLGGVFVLRRVAGGQAGLDGDVGAGATGRDRAGTQRREMRLVGRDAGRNGFPRAAGGDPEHVLEHDLVGEVGDREHRAVAGAADEIGVDTRVRGRDAGDLVLHVFEGLEPELGAEPRRQLLGDAPVLHGGALGRDETRLAHHPSFEVGGGAGLLAPHRRRQEHVGARGRVVGERTHRHDEPDRVERGPHADAVGEVLFELGAEQHQRVDGAGGGGVEHTGGVETTLRRHAAPRLRVDVAGGVEGDASGEEARREAEVERPVHVAAPQRREELDAGQRRERRRRLYHCGGRLRERLAPEHDDDVAVATVERAHRLLDGSGTRAVPSPARARANCSAITPASPGACAQHRGDVAGETARPRGDLDDRYAELHRGASHPEVENRQLLPQVGRDEHDCASAVEVGDGGAGKAEHDLGGQAVAELRVDVVGADHALGEAGPHVGVLVGAARAAEHRDRRRTVRVERGPQAGRRRVERFGPRHLDQLAVLAHHRRAHTIGGVHPLEAVAALVAEPAVVHRFGVDAEQADEPVRRRSAARPGTAPRTWCTTSRRSRGPTAAPGTGMRSRSARRPGRSARCCRRSTRRTAGRGR